MTNDTPASTIDDLCSRLDLDVAITSPTSLQCLFASVERVGWQFRPGELRARPFDQPRPLLMTQHPTWAASADAELLRRTQMSRVMWTGAGFCALVAFGALLGALGNVGSNTGGAIEALLWFVLFATAAVGLLAFPAMRGAHFRRRVGQDERRWATDSVLAVDTHIGALSEWQSARVHHDTHEAEHLDRQVVWHPIDLEHGRAIDVFGGKADHQSRGWRHLLVQIGASSMSLGRHLDVIDLTGDRVADDLVTLAKLGGSRTETIDLETQLDRVSLSPRAKNHLPELLAQSLRGSDEEVSATAMATDLRILGQICSVLGTNVSIPRIHGALGLVFGDRPDDGLLGAAEADAVRDLFGDRYLEHAGKHIAELRDMLDPVRSFGSAVDVNWVMERSPNLRVVQMTGRQSRFTNGASIQLLVQLLIDAVEEAGSTNDTVRTVIVAGADPLRRRNLELLDEVAASNNVRLVYLFRHLRDDGLEVIGRGRTTVFMCLTNGKEASAAADQIGRDVRFVVHQVSMSRGISDNRGTTDTHGTSQGNTFGTSSGNTSGLHNSSSTGRSQSSSTGVSDSTSTSTSTGTSEQRSAARQRVDEFVVRPEQIQTMADTALLIVDADHHGRRVRFGDCGAQVALDAVAHRAIRKL